MIVPQYDQFLEKQQIVCHYKIFHLEYLIKNTFKVR